MSIAEAENPQAIKDKLFYAGGLSRDHISTISAKTTRLQE